MRTTFTAILLAVAAITWSAVPNVNVYRNDNKFGRYDIGNDFTFVHTQRGSTMVLRLSSGEELPLSIVDSCLIRTVDVPTVHITLTDYPTATMLWDKELYLSATLAIEGNGLVDDLEATTLQIKGRGNSTWLMPKKPMRLKFPRKTKIGNLNKAKNYALLANYIDPSLCRNAIMMWLTEQLGIPYRNHGMPCDVYFNNNYLGSYLLTEKVGINSGSVDIDETQGILLELSSEYDEKYKFHSAVYNLPVMVKDPDFDELYEDDPTTLQPQERLALWRADFIAAEQAVRNGKPFEKFDLDSFVDYILVYDVLLNGELGHPKSMYIHKTSLAEGEKYCMGPIWDFDNALNTKHLNNGRVEEISPNSTLWVNDMLVKMMSTNEFQQAYKARLKYFIDDIYPRLLAFIDEYSALVEPSAKVNGLLWAEPDDLGWIYAVSSFDHHSHIAELKSWITRRVAYLKTRL